MGKGAYGIGTLVAAIFGSCYLLQHMFESLQYIYVSLFFSLWSWAFALPKLTVQTKDFISMVSYVRKFHAPTELDQSFFCQC